MTDETKTRRPLETPFRQQTLKAWRPILTPKAVIITFSIVGILFIPIGVLILSESQTVVEVMNSGGNYGTTCCRENCLPSDEGPRRDANPCVINITVSEDMQPPIYMYYKLSDFYQNHRRYVKSRLDAQLRGVPNLVPSLLEADCSSFFRHEDNQTAAGDDYDKITNVISPCGLISRSMFNDSFQLKKADGTTIMQTSKGIAWPSDVASKYNNSNDGSTGNHFQPFSYAKQASCADFPDKALNRTCHEHNTGDKHAGWCFPQSGYCVEDEHFMVWMRTAGLPTFRKLFAIIGEELKAGEYLIEVSNGELKGDTGLYHNYYDDTPQMTLFPVHGYGGEKHVVMSTVSWMGGKNPFLGYAYVVVGAICLALALLFLVKDRLSPRRLGDPSYITFNKKEGDK